MQKSTRKNAIDVDDGISKTRCGRRDGYGGMRMHRKIPQVGYVKQLALTDEACHSLKTAGLVDQSQSAD